MTPTGTEPLGQYTIDRLYAVNLEFKLLSEGDDEFVDAKSSREILWNWHFQDHARISVVFGLSSTFAGDAVARARAAYACDFSLPEVDPIVPLGSFVRLNAVATLFPYVREALSSLHSRGPFDVPQIQPANIARLQLPKEAAGIAQIRDSTEFRAVAARLGLAIDDASTQSAALERGSEKPKKAASKRHATKQK